jgi:hypothetical protein
LRPGKAPFPPGLSFCISSLDNIWKCLYGRAWSSKNGAESAIMKKNPGVRYVLRNRARYEVANNSYAKGIDR